MKFVQVVIDDMTKHLESGCACCHTEGWRNSLAQLFPQEDSQEQRCENRSETKESVG